MYQTFYQLQSDPFRLAPDPRFRYSHRSYAAAYRHLRDAYEQGDGFGVVTARPGTGKTTLTEEFIASLDPARVLVAKLVTTQVDATELLRLIGYGFGADIEGADRATTWHRLEQRLASERDRGRRALLVVDEAQGLSTESLEQLRLLSNLEHRDQALLQIFLVGQEQLQARLAAPELEQLQQRVSVVCRLAPLSLSETRAYAHHRLCVAGWRGDPAIDPAVFILVHRFGQGLPRYINRLCNRLLLHGAVAEKHELSTEDAGTILLDLSEELLTPVHDQPGPTGASNRELLAAVVNGEYWRAMLSAQELSFLQQAEFEPPPILLSSVAASEAVRPAPQAPQPPAHSNWWRWTASAAALLLVVLYLAGRFGPPDAVAEFRSAFVRQPAATAQTPAAATSQQVPLNSPSAAEGTIRKPPESGAEVTPKPAAASADSASREAPIATDDFPALRDTAAAANEQPAFRNSPVTTANLSFMPTDLLQRQLESTPADAPESVTGAPPPSTPTDTAGTKPADAAAPSAVDILLDRAERALADDRLTMPADDSAYGYLKAAQRLDPDEPAVARGFDRIAERYGVLAKWWMNQGEYGKATQLIERGLQVRPHYAALHALRTEMHAMTLKGKQPSPFPSAFDDANTNARSPAPEKQEQHAPANLFERFKTFLRGGARDGL